MTNGPATNDVPVTNDGYVPVTNDGYLKVRMAFVIRGGIMRNGYLKWNMEIMRKVFGLI